MVAMRTFRVFALLAAVAALGVVTTADASGVVISFDDIAPAESDTDYISDEYAAEGVSFVTDDGVVSAGLSAGDPGGWGLEASTGSQFLGFDGPSFTATINFSGEATMVSVDVARANGSEPGDVVTIEAYCGGTLVSTADPDFQSINDWTKVVFLSACIDSLVVTGEGPFGIDNLQADLTVVVQDSDDDGILDAEDLCPDTSQDTTVPAVQLGTNRWALLDGDNEFDTSEPPGRGPRRTYSLADTGGCNATQIADALELGQGHYKFGLSTGVMDEWISRVGNMR